MCKSLGAKKLGLKVARCSGRARHAVPIERTGGADLEGVGARLLEPQTKGEVDCSLAITRLPSRDSAKANGGPRGMHGSAGATLLLTESDFAYVGEPYAVSPDGTIYQPFADESGYMILIHRFEEVQP